MDLKDAMYEASDTPPPTTIDVDRLIAGERRRTHGLRLAGVVAGLTVLALGATLMPRYFGDNLAPPVVAAAPGSSPRPTPSMIFSTQTVFPSHSGPGSSLPPITAPCSVPGAGAPPLRPVTEACDEATGRLAGSFGGNFQSLMGNEWPTPRFVRNPDVAVGYIAVREYNGGGHHFVLIVRLIASPIDLTTWSAANPCTANCPQVTAHGTTVSIADRTLWLGYRSDGTEVAVNVQNKGPDDAPITAEDLAQLGDAPEMTLYPTAG
ncbi:hypothetical protein [Dactylosporangium matsuzakiense]|uniref:Uncharacterized protein n=1 Tax=Dactylosporangium matsuzakiense TaxID=53360 RepID=A0A9W6KMH3_9ACTN|nr:hypothetical protein [Dactylosporangium matsuzakiense]UWZ44919.1 hypothetical protein Dmats_47760 [Dactylosporangium matsuzakiense]GLL03600.1 hypothetical protein GCM10017581_053460 [Dactylosporangium matsuzakiense]